jgi:hypothetical protein
MKTLKRLWCNYWDWYMAHDANDRDCDSRLW